jgi:ornithine cyclodeaminase
MTAPLWIGERDLRLDIKQSIALLRKAMQRQASGHALSMDKTHVLFPGGTMHAIGATFTDTTLLGVKTWAHTPKGATPLEILWDGETGNLLAIIEAFAMGQLRTAGMAGLVTDCLADSGADLMTICGTGKQAMAQIAAVAAIRRIKTVRVYGRNAERASAFATHVQNTLSLKTELFDAVAAAVKDVPIVTLITRAKEPFLAAPMPTCGAHINAMGAITPERQEFDPALLARCSAVVVHNTEQAKKLSSELIAAWGKNFDRPNLATVSELVACAAGRPANADLTLFKSLGTGIADLALAEEIYNLARERGIGRELPTPTPVPLSFENQ